VREGDVVARLFSDEYEASLRRAVADLELARAGLERVRAEARTVESALAVARSSRDAATSEVERSRALLDLAQKSYDRTVELQKVSIESRQRLDERASELAAAQAALTTAEARRQAADREVAQAEARIDAARAGIVEAEAGLGVLAAVRDQAAATLDKTYVRAPFDGIVVLKDAEVGEVVSPNVQGGSNARGSVVTMVYFSSLEVQAEVPETSLAAVKVGARAQIFLDAFPDTAYAGRVSRIWPTANRTKATVEVRVALETIDERMRPEMGVRVVFLEETAAVVGDSADAPDSEALQDVTPVVVVERGAVVRVDGSTGVFLLDRDVARFHPVATGEESGGRIVITQGLAGGEELVRDPPASLKDGDRIVREEKP
jgi:RND family efflux transporter MFP subunit